MKRFLASVLSLSISLVAAPPSAWSQVAAVAGQSGASSVSGAAAASRFLPQLPYSAAGPSYTSEIRLAPALNLVPVPGGNGVVAIPTAQAMAHIPSGSAVSRTGAATIVVPAAIANASRFSAAAGMPVRGVEALRALPTSEEVSIPAATLVRMPGEGARSSAASAMDRLLGLQSADESAPVSPESLGGASVNALTPSRFDGNRNGPPIVPATRLGDNGPRGSKPVRAVIAVLRVVGAAAAVVGLHAAAVAFLPAIFGVVPVAAVWAVSSGLLLAPVALFARYRLAKRDSPRLNKVKIVMDVALGAFVGAVFIAAPALGFVLSGAGLAAAAVPLLAVAGGRWLGGTAFADTALVWGAVSVTPMLVGVAAAGAIGLGPILGLMALPMMTTLSFFLGRLIHSAETGAPFSVPGSMQKIRFPSFQWVMIGVVFALLTGYSAVYTNIAFLAWTLLGGREGKSFTEVRAGFKPTIGGIFKTILSVVTFDRVYLALLAFTAFTGFASPLTFLVIAFSGERAAVWTERLLGRFLPKSAAAPSTREAPPADPELLADEPAKWPAFHYWAKTFALVGSMAGIGVLMAVTVFGVTSLLTNLGIASVLAFVPFFFAKNIIKALMKAKPTTKEQDPEFFRIMEELRDRINAKRRAAGKKEIPMPEMVIDPMPVPNAYATGRSPYKAMVGVTVGIKRMLLDPETARDGLVRLLGSVEPGSKAFKTFRLAISGTIPGIAADAAPAEVAAAVLKADRVQLKALGERMLRGVLGHEFSHVMDRHMLSGSIAGAISSGVAFASYGVMWAVGHVKTSKLNPFRDRSLDKRPQSGAQTGEGENGSGVKPEAFEPITTGIVLKSLPALMKLFVALWAPVAMQIIQMASSRNNEGMADEDGALLTEDPESLALALGMLTTWRPPSGLRLMPVSRLPMAAALQHIMIVNPIEQMQGAGALPKTEAAGAPTRADDFMFEMFITHPNTNTRIEKLHDMSQAMKGVRADKPRPPSPDGGGGGGGGKPLAFAPMTAPSSIGGGLLLGAWKGFKNLFRVLPDEGRNREYWKFTLGQAVTMLGVNFHYTALPKLVAPDKADASKLGYNRAINWGAQALSSLTTGPLVDRASTQKVVVWTYVARSLLMMSVPILFFHGYLTFAVFAGLVAAAGFLQSMGMTAGSVAFNRILANDTAHYNKAYAVFTVVLNLVGVVGPLLAGAFIGAMDARYGLLAGNALAYVVYGGLMLVTAIGYAIFLKLPRDEMMQARRDLGALLEEKGVGGARYRGISAASMDGKPTLIVEVTGDLSLVSGVPAEFDGKPVTVIAQRRVMRELVEGFRLVWANRFLRLYLLFMTLALMASDALIFAALPRYIADVLQPGSTAMPALAAIPLLGPLFAGLTSKAGAFGLFLAAASLGTGVGSALSALAKDPAQVVLVSSSVDFRAALAARDAALSGEQLDAAATALRVAPAVVLRRYAAEWVKDAAASKDAAQLAADSLEEAAHGVAAALAIPVEEARALLVATGAERAARAVLARRGVALLKEAAREARTGMDRLQRQGRWSSWLHGLSWLAYIGVFFAGGLWTSVGALLVSALLAAPAVVIWSSLVTKVVAGSYPESQGKIYSAMFFYQLLCSIGGVLLFGWLMTFLPTMTVLMVTGGVLAVCALLDFLQPWRVFPLNRKN